MSKPKILISNDDGIDAHGIQALTKACESFAEVWVVAPDRERSATSHAISLQRPLRVREVGPRKFTVDGTPTDCVYMGLHHLMPARPALVLGGINHGANLGNDVLYSGTVAVAMEGALFGYPAMAVSLCISDHAGTPIDLEDFAVAAALGAELAAEIIAKPLPCGVVLNVNVPFVAREAIQGTKLCRLGYTDWSDAVSVRKDPRNKPYYWIGGDRLGTDDIQDSDNNAIAAGYVSLTPIHYDLTDYRSFDAARRLSAKSFSRTADQLGSAPLAYPRHPRS